MPSDRGAAFRCTARQSNRSAERRHVFSCARRLTTGYGEHARGADEASVVLYDAAGVFQEPDTPDPRDA